MLEFESRLWQKCEKKKYEEAFDIYKKAKDEFHTCLHASPDSAWALNSLKIFWMKVLFEFKIWRNNSNDVDADDGY